MDKVVQDEALIGARVAALPGPVVFTNGVFDILHRGHVTYLAQARALVQLQQRSAAVAILMQLSASKQQPIDRAALADLGSLKVQDGATQQGLQFLKRACEPCATDWPGRAQAEADLGLTYLMLGQEQDGLQALQRARAAFQAAGDEESYAKALWNELQYFEHVGQKKPAELARAELERMQF